MKNSIMNEVKVVSWRNLLLITHRIIDSFTQWVMAKITHIQKIKRIKEGHMLLSQ